MMSEIVEGSRVRWSDKPGTVLRFRSFTEDGVRYTFATVQWDSGGQAGVDTDELDLCDD
jgi:hypothetical protein